MADGNLPDIETLRKLLAFNIFPGLNAGDFQEGYPLVQLSVTRRRQTWCAYAYRRRHRSRFWRSWVVAFDWLMGRRHPCGHCLHEHRTYHGDEG